MNEQFQNRVHLALPMRNKQETAHFYGEMLQLPVVDYSPTELAVDLFDQHIAFHQVEDFFEVKAPVINLKTGENTTAAVSSFHFGAVIRHSDFDSMVALIQKNNVEVLLGPAAYRWPDGKYEYMIQFYDCNGFNLELKANSADEMYSLDDLAKWSHKA